MISPQQERSLQLRMENLGYVTPSSLRGAILKANQRGCVEIDLNTETPRYRVLYFIHIQ